jgi:phenylalanyl-tRNA synthetase alpha chain
MDGIDEQALIARIEGAADLAALEAERVAALGKQGAVTQLLKTLGKMRKGARRVRGSMRCARR